MSSYFRPLDVVKGPNGYIGIVTETNGTTASVDWIDGIGKGYIYNAWWNHKDNPHCGENKGSFPDGLVVIDSMLRILLNGMAHPMGDNRNQWESMMGISLDEDDE